MNRFKPLFLLIAFVFVQNSVFAQSSGQKIFDLLTGGKNSPDGKSWKFVPDPHAAGVGPMGDITGDYYNYPTGLGGLNSWANGALKNTFTFRPDSIFIPQNQKASVNFLYARKDFGLPQKQYSDTALIDKNLKTAPFKFKQDTGVSYSTNYRIEIQNGSYIGYFWERYNYQIAKISNDTMILCQGYDDQYGDREPSKDKNMAFFTFVNVATPTAVNIFTLLTGGPSYPQGKTWKISSNPHLTTVGPIGDVHGTWYNYPDGLLFPAFNKGLLNNSFTFRYDTIYIPQNQNITAYYSYANKVFGLNQKQYADTNLKDPNHIQAPFIFKEDTGVSYSTNYRIEIQNKSYIGYFDERYDYQITKIETDTLVLCHTYSDNLFSDPSKDGSMRCFTFYQVPTILALYNDEIDNIKEVNIYPNPVVNRLEFSTNVSSFIIYNNQGTEICKGSGNHANVIDLSTGSYVVRLVDKQAKTVIKHFNKE